MEIPRNWDSDFQMLIQVCWHHNPTKRPSFGEIVERLQILCDKHPKKEQEDRTESTRELLQQKKFPDTLRQIQRKKKATVLDMHLFNSPKNFKKKSTGQLFMQNVS